MNTPLPIADYLPHSGRMLLLDHIVQVDERAICTRLTLRADSPFVEGGQVGAWIGLEYMAQAAAAHAGWCARQRNQAVSAGFLLGTRLYDSSVAAFNVGDTLLVSAANEFSAGNGMSMLACRIEAPDGRLLAQAQLSVFQPADLQAHLQQSGESTP
ncbi:Predicted 3-hydroxylacyl-ACP dehydratase, HotDog domain [Andreprevotia lacus DSM 23236]|jgi:predicted hotdog family 3-hydroxylacyl-ACP dehydratase|uniref:Predicted 3-hydroxylacyl-ACP dehydratase, HotDog domain n=1 Tax=Andreprevotia lacus DSM 23236 TaxID=1121001 RepID=A0A1W1X4B7_9NEIS|nr:hypothetical protein [Andreprevotia lacus]SMC18558.1 Predicted 3-hydroxylacyl-ACP dehydratase, HotDog domain [Andreprevotia lacus DSM 23236]